MKAYETKNGQAIEPYAHAAPGFQTVKIENGSRYRLCQILPAIPQRFEWVNESNIRECGQ